jgi:hypothetical protein
MLTIRGLISLADLAALIVSGSFRLRATWIG